MFSVPGEITSSLSIGTNRLLRSGAAVVTSAADVLESFGLAARPRDPPPLGERAATVLARLRDAPAGADELTRELGLGSAELATALAELEVAGLIAESAGIYRA